MTSEIEELRREIEELRYPIALLRTHPVFQKFFQGGPFAIPAGGFLLTGRRVVGGNPTLNQVLGWDGSKYTPQTPAAGGGGYALIRENGVDQIVRSNLNIIDPDAGAALVQDDPGVPLETELHLELYTLLAGRAGGQSLAGGTAADEDLILRGTTSSTSIPYSPIVTLTVDIPAADNTAYPSAITLTVNIPAANAAYNPPIVISEGGTFLAADTTLTVGLNTVEIGDILLIEAEKLKVTAKPTTDDLTVIRGVAGTAAVDHADGLDVVQSGTSFVYTSAADDVEVNDVILVANLEKMKVTGEDTVNNILTVVRGVGLSNAVSHAAAATVRQSGLSFVYTSTGDPVAAADILLVDTEKMFVSAVDGINNILTVDRAADSTTAAAHAAAAAVAYWTSSRANVILVESGLIVSSNRRISGSGGVLNLYGTGRIDMLDSHLRMTSGNQIQDSAGSARITIGNNGITVGGKLALQPGATLPGGGLGIHVAPSPFAYAYIGRGTGTGMDGQVGVLVDMGLTTSSLPGAVIGVSGRALARDATTTIAYGLDYLAGAVSPANVVGARTQGLYQAAVANYTGFLAKGGILVGGSVTTWTGFGLEGPLPTATNKQPFTDTGVAGPSGDANGNRFSWNTQFASGMGAFGGGLGVIGIANAATAPTTNPAGGVVFASIGGQLYQRGLMSVNEPLQSKLSAQAAGAAQNTFTAETVLNSTTFNVPANALVAGAVLRLTARGVYGTTGAPTAQVRIRWGGILGVLLADSTLFAMPTTVTNRGWEVSFLIRVVSIGAAGTFECQGWWKRALTLSTSEEADLEATAALTVDTTAAKDLVLTWTWGTSNISNTVTVRQYLLERVA